MKKQDSYMQI